MNTNAPVDILLQKIADLVYFEVCTDIIDAITREKQIKGWSRKKKDALVNALNSAWADLYPSLC